MRAAMLCGARVYYFIDPIMSGGGIYQDLRRSLWGKCNEKDALNLYNTLILRLNIDFRERVRL